MAAKTFAQNSAWRTAPALVLTALLAGCSCLQADGPILTETREVDPFEVVEQTGDVQLQLDYTSGAEGAVTVTAEQSLLEAVEVEVANQVLRVATTECFSNSAGVTAAVTAGSLRELQLRGVDSLRAGAVFLDNELRILCEGQGVVYLESLLSPQNLRIEHLGTGRVIIDDLRADTVFIDLTSSGLVELSGSADVLILTQPGLGTVRLLDLPVQHAEVTVSGSGRAEVNAFGSLTIDVARQGEVFHQGGAVPEVSGQGTVTRVN